MREGNNLISSSGGGIIMIVVVVLRMKGLSVHAECELLVARSTPQRGRDPLDIQHGAGQVGTFADERPAEGERVRDDLAQLPDAQVDHFHPARTGVTSGHVGDGPAQGQLMHAVARCRSSSGVPGYPDPESMIAFAVRPWTT